MGLLDDFYAGLSDAADKAGTNISSGLSDPNVLQGLLAMGLTMMANNTGGASVGETLGRGGLAGLQQYGTAKETEQKQADNALARQKVQQELESGGIDIQSKKLGLAQQTAGVGLLNKFLHGDPTDTTATPAATTPTTPPTVPVDPDANRIAPLGYNTATNSVSAVIAPDVTSTGTPGVPALPASNAAPVGAPIQQVPVRQPIPPGGIEQPSIVSLSGALPGSALANAGPPKVGANVAATGPYDALVPKLQGALAALSPELRLAAMADIAVNGLKNLPEYLKPDVKVLDNGLIFNNRTQKVIGSVPMKDQNGVYTSLTQEPDGTYKVSAVPGGLELVAAAERARLGAQGENKFTTIYINGRNVMVTEAQAKQLLNSGAGTVAPPAGGTGTGAAPVGGPPASTGSAQPAGTSGVGLPTGPSTSETSHTKAVDLATQRFFEKDQPAAQAAASTAQSIIDSAPILRANATATGFLAPAKAQVAAVLDGLGMHEYAKNADIAQTFNAVAGKPVADALIANKGTQTEGDAARARALYPQLSNTPDANRFMIDYMVAQARVQQSQNNYYNEAYARLAAANRLDLVHTIPVDWARNHGSVWDQPEMQPWKPRADAALAAQRGGKNAP